MFIGQYITERGTASDGSLLVPIPVGQLLFAQKCKGCCDACFSIGTGCDPIHSTFTHDVAFQLHRCSAVITATPNTYQFQNTLAVFQIGSGCVAFSLRSVRRLLTFAKYCQGSNKSHHACMVVQENKPNIGERKDSRGHQADCLLAQAKFELQLLLCCGSFFVTEKSIKEMTQAVNR